MVPPGPSFISKTFIIINNTISTSMSQLIFSLGHYIKHSSLSQLVISANFQLWTPVGAQGGQRLPGSGSTTLKVKYMHQLDRASRCPHIWSSITLSGIFGKGISG